jgi:hypothetical protein
MKDEMPLTDRDFAGVRRSVMAAIEARRTRRAWTLRALQLAFAVLAVIVGAWWMTRPADTPVTSAPGPRVPRFARTQSNTTAQQHDLGIIDPLSHVATRDLHHDRTPRIASRRQHHHSPVHEIAVLTEPLRLELRTDDPDIRIIWITNPTDSR